MRSAYKVKVMSVEEFRDNVSSKCEADSAVVLPPALLIRFYNQLLSVREGFSKKMRKSLVICQTGGGGSIFQKSPTCTSLSGSDQRRSQRRPVSGTSVGRMILLKGFEVKHIF